MKCPKCDVDMKIYDNATVHRPDGTYAQRMRLECISPNCENYQKIVEVIYHPIDVEEEEVTPA